MKTELKDYRKMTEFNYIVYTKDNWQKNQNDNIID